MMASNLRRVENASSSVTAKRTLLRPAVAARPPAADIEHLHSPCEPCATEYVLGEIPEQFALKFQAAKFAFRIAQRVGARIHGGRSRAAIQIAIGEGVHAGSPFVPS